jgi:peptide/nickel transport system substrate-binding protein
MKRFDWRWIAASSLLIAALAAAETRPQYGGTLHLTMHEAPTTLDPADTAQTDSLARRNLSLLMFETLVTLDERGQLHPALAASWQASAGNRRWRLQLRGGIKFHDGSQLTTDWVAASLRAANPSWNVLVDADSIVIERNSGDPNLLAELALAKNAIIKRNPDRSLSGTGPFHIVDWKPGKSLSLAAYDDCWQGRPFLNAIEIEMGRSFHDQLTTLELGQAELVEIAPEQAHRVPIDTRRVLNSSPMQLVALVFSRDAQSDEEKALRMALALSVDRSSIRNVLLQGSGQPTGSVLPNWMSGYGFVFPTDNDLPKARQAIAQLRNIPIWTIGYDNNDTLARVMAERIVLNARDVGVKLQIASGTTADLRLTWIPLGASDPWIALMEIAHSLGFPIPKRTDGSAEELYSAERELLATQRLIPLFHLPVTYAAAAGVRNFSLYPDGSWNVASVWLEAGKP